MNRELLVGVLYSRIAQIMVTRVLEDNALILLFIWTLSHATGYVHIFNIYSNHEMWEEARKIVELRSSIAFGWKKPGKAWIQVGSNF